MRNEALITFIGDYIAGRRQAKLAAFEKEAAKLFPQDEQQTEKRHALERRYTPQNWLTDAAARAGQISLVTHAAKFTHSEAKNSSIYSEVTQTEGYLCSAALDSLQSDAVGNAAALDVAKLLQSEVAGDSLLACLKRKDYRALAAFAENPQQLAQWVAGFSQALTIRTPAAHTLAKQIYFPFEAGYHLLCPLFASSLAHAMHQHIAALRFSEEAKAVRQARRNRSWHAKALVQFPRLAEMHFGGTKPQNISALNTARTGRVWLLCAQPPRWQQQAQPPVDMASIFRPGAQFDRLAKPRVRMMTNLLVQTGSRKNYHIRQSREQYVNEIIDILFSCANQFQHPAWQGWTLKCPTLHAHQQLWLDPWRAKTDETFRLLREQDEWQAQVAQDFASWFNYRLRQRLPDVGQTEKHEWETRPWFRQQLRDMEHIIREGLR